MEQISFKGDQFEISKDFIITNRTLVADFFGDNRDWYAKLKNGGTTYRRTSLDSQEAYDGDLESQNLDEQDLPPVEPERITEERAEEVNNFFNEYPVAKDVLMEYLNFNLKENI